MRSVVNVRARESMFFHVPAKALTCVLRTEWYPSRRAQMSPTVETLGVIGSVLVRAYRCGRAVKELFILDITSSDH